MTRNIEVMGEWEVVMKYGDAGQTRTGLIGAKTYKDAIEIFKTDIESNGVEVKEVIRCEKVGSIIV